jgi:hypothetical protein
MPLSLDIFGRSELHNLQCFTLGSTTVAILALSYVCIVHENIEFCLMGAFCKSLILCLFRLAKC